MADTAAHDHWAWIGQVEEDALEQREDHLVDPERPHQRVLPQGRDRLRAVPHRGVRRVQVDRRGCRRRSGAWAGRRHRIVGSPDAPRATRVQQHQVVRERIDARVRERHVHEGAVLPLA